MLGSETSVETEVVMRRSALIVAIASLAGVLTTGAVSNVAAASVRPASTTCTVFNAYSALLSVQAVCAYGSGIVTNGGLTIQWANGQTSTTSGPGTETPVSDRLCPAIAGDTLSEALKTTGGTVTSGPLAGSQVRGRFCLYTVNPSRGLPPGTGYFQNLGIFHL